MEWSWLFVLCAYHARLEQIFETVYIGLDFRSLIRPEISDSLGTRIPGIDHVTVSIIRFRPISRFREIYRGSGNFSRVRLVTEVFEADPTLFRVATRSGSVIENLHWPDCHIRLLDVDPVIGQQRAPCGVCMLISSRSATTQVMNR